MEKKNDTSSENINGIEMDFTTGQPLIIYKTKLDYSQNVPVILSEDKLKIVSYPHPTDVFYKSKLAYPIKLENEYLLDNLGININIAYLSLTLKEYSQYKDVPLLKELYKLIIDQNPLKEFYNCGNRQNLTNELIEINNIITQERLVKCKCLKNSMIY
tara:strand:- start:400 stop:873 length:474 start_codon:yes stop_codon:yes gene_type:complete